MKTYLKPSGKRTYLFINDEKVKMIPKKYQEISVDVLKANISNENKVFLQNDERFNLEHHLFLEQLRKEEKYVHELIDNVVVEEALFVNVKFGNDRTELKYTNSVSVKCPAILYQLFNHKRSIYSNT